MRSLSKQILSMTTIQNIKFKTDTLSYSYVAHNFPSCLEVHYLQLNEVYLIQCYHCAIGERDTNIPEAGYFQWQEIRPLIICKIITVRNSFIFYRRKSYTKGLSKKVTTSSCPCKAWRNLCKSQSCIQNLKESIYKHNDPLFVLFTHCFVLCLPL